MIKTNILNISNGELCVDNSGMSDYWTCPLYYLYHQVLRKESTEISPSALNFGSAIHIWLENFYFQSDVGLANDAMEDHFEKNPQELGDYRSMENAFRLTEEYVSQYGEERDFVPLEVIEGGVEIPVKCLLGEIRLSSDLMGWDRLYKAGEWIKIYWTGKIDILTKDGMGRNMLIDHKTTSRMGFNYFTQFRLSGQFRGYCFSVNNLYGEEIGWTEKFMINALQLTNKGNIELARQEFSLNKQMIEEWQRKVMIDIEGLVEMAQQGEWSSNGWKSCAWIFARACPFCSVCETAEKDRGLVLNSGLYKKYCWNPLSD